MAALGIIVLYLKIYEDLWKKEDFLSEIIHLRRPHGRGLGRSENWTFSVGVINVTTNAFCKFSIFGKSGDYKMKFIV